MSAPETASRGSRTRSGADWVLRAGPLDYALAFSDVCAALPVVGRHLRPMGTLTAVAAWGSRHVPTAIASLLSGGLAVPTGRAGRSEAARLRTQTNEAAAAALAGLVGDHTTVTWPGPDRLPPVLQAGAQRRRFLYRTGVRYGAAADQLLDVWRRADLPPGPAPVLVFVHGGGWIHGGRQLQGYALMSHLAERGWVCLSVNYRVAPQHRWPRHIQDVKAAVAWARANVDRFGGDRAFVAIAGVSAGGHLAALTGLSADDADLGAELAPSADSSVDAVVGVYGRYDWADRSTRERDEFVGFLERIVVRKRLATHPQIFEQASPIARVRPDAPPFLVVHGSADSVIPVAQARAFVERLRGVSASQVGHLELPGAGHGFDLIDRWRTRGAVTAIGAFLDEVHRRHLVSLAGQAI